ncbi:eukaryotic translation initiation factor 4 gamma 2 isoform X1 [Cimex lectularius]|uniref:Eukaryotic translation initiation factor 4 gamma 2 n=1 Tax=Cimex lectularius TaxID=79782 RepID=A0A8I6REA3_CIMLE|nr:eukaryotic translation initiation factor 4 gamma 2 isoform X1 [Cimex lectularius]XP_014240858.1 eukaryotic translation initiation factor 4 gamma 2 isoform X1 [Cimex lectularius]XP_014240859.1 eukaryotic translation initiation factor 4 gamma 2 isoform X1 [Cimex lectularius]XP_014240860.1 eukaryotic translation initiation factor 4 gamma 2 isoform X1 [Cimex lectularius]
MYAQLCRRLCKEAPGPNKDEPCTFKSILLSICKTQFENRSKQISDKRKSLGNIKFIGELCKLEIAHKGIIFSCMKKLLESKPNHQEMAEDIECLCQILRTCGQILDNDEAQGLMDQMFQRMSKLTKNVNLPIRIRFMLRDIIELRRDGWVPRKASNTEGPLPMNQLCDESSQIMRGNTNERPPQQELFPRPLQTRTTGLDIMLSGSVSFLQPEKLYNNNSNGYHNSSYSSSRERGSQRHNHHQQNNHFYQQNRYNNHHHNNNNNNSNNISNSKDVPARFVKKIQIGHENSGNVDQVSLRPPANSMLIKLPNTKPVSSHIFPGKTGIGDSINPSTLKPNAPIQSAKVPILIKQASADRNKPNKKEKAATKEETIKKAIAIAEEVLSGTNIDDAAANFAQLKPQDRLIPECLSSMLAYTYQKTDNDRETVMSLLMILKKNGAITSSQFHDAFRSILKPMPDLVATVPNICEYIAGFASMGIIDGCLTIAQLGELTEDGAHFPLLFLTLANLNKKLGKERLMEMFRESKVSLMNCLSGSERTKSRLNEVLEEKGLVFLEPLFVLESELWAALEREPSAQSLYKCAKDSVAPELQSTSAFITALITVSLRYIIQESTRGKELTNETVNDKMIIEKEKALLEKFKNVLRTFLNENIDLQVTAVYALQVFCFTYDFPKGLLLRWFMNLYNMEIVDEEAFLKWREDVTDIYPGKGKALFQVNQWLTWLAEAESEEEEDEEGDN